jgi:peptidoglycan/LPS O-acetylase OafA/YrhL
MIFLIMVPAYSMPEQFSWSALWQSILLGHNLPGAYAAAPYTDMFWAISVEFAFYLMFPFLCVILKKNGVSTFVAMIVVLIVFRGLATIFGGNPRDFSYFTLLGRLDQFLIGMLLGALSGAKPEQRPNLWLFPLTALFWSVILWQFNQMGGWPLVVWWKILWPTIEALLAALFIYSYLRFSFYIPSPIATTLRGIGVISYSLYLVHMIVITLVLDQAPQFTWMPHSATWLIAGLIIPGTFLLATLTYFAIERPFLGLRRRYFLVASP